MQAAIQNPTLAPHSSTGRRHFVQDRPCVAISVSQPHPAAAGVFGAMGTSKHIV
jgi:hypothetical protein